LEWRVSVREARRDSGEKLDTKSIGHRALAKIGFAGKMKLHDARIAYWDKCWWFDVVPHPTPFFRNAYFLPNGRVKSAACAQGIGVAAQPFHVATAAKSLIPKA
jgi:hypothetical protein